MEFNSNDVISKHHVLSAHVPGAVLNPSPLLYLLITLWLGMPLFTLWIRKSRLKKIKLKIVAKHNLNPGL